MNILEEGYEMNKKKSKRVMSIVLTVIMVVSLLVGMPMAEFSEVQAASTLNNPRTGSNGVVTWDCVYFGRYPQSDATGIQEDAIKWRVLSVNGNDALLMADCNLDVQQYYDKTVDITWATSTIRSWLNGYGYTSNASQMDYTKSNFIDRAFTEVEQGAIKATTENNDKVSLLSYAEATNTAYGFSQSAENDKARERVNTAYVAAGGSSVHNVDTNAAGQTDSWWLRSQPEVFPNNAYYVNILGKIDRVIVSRAKIAICPIIQLDLSASTLWSYAGTVSTDGSTTPGEEPPVISDAEVPVEDPETGDSYVESGTDGEDKTVEYVAPDNNATTAEIPNEVTINGVTYKVTSIADNAFKNNKKIKKVVIDSNITSIGKNAFYGCTKLQSVKIGKNVKTIGSKAFYGCTKLTTVTMGNNVTTIGDKAFYKCSKLKKITIPSKVNKIGKQAFYKCKNLKTITIKTKKLKSSNVGSQAFKGVYSKATYKVPKAKLSAYKRLLKKKGVSSKAKIKK